MDLAPRNILLLPDDSFCLLDWEAAGCYPRSFEHASLRLMAGQSGNFHHLLLDRMEALTAEEEAQVKAVIEAYGNNKCFRL
jgi:thiamine kinase-like enzyme